MHEGKGGSYIRDPETGELTLVQRTKEAKAGEPASADNPPVRPTSKSVKKEV